MRSDARNIRHSPGGDGRNAPSASMTIRPRLVSSWPKLAWLARVEVGSLEIEVFHGPMVETTTDWIVEAVWAGEFAAGDFDRTDLVYGTGVRCRGSEAVFVSPSAAVACLWYFRQDGTLHVSNSLPALLAAAKLSLREDYDRYDLDLADVEIRGILNCTKSIPVHEGEIHVVYCRNLHYDGRDVKELDQPSPDRDFLSFAKYRAFLTETAEALGANCRDQRRRNLVDGLTGISSGYDSPACAVVAREAGFMHTATIVNSNSLWRGSDSGEVIARKLGMACDCYHSHPRHYRGEIEIFAKTGRNSGFNLSLFDYPQPLCLLFDGVYGDTVWDRFPHDLSSPTGDWDNGLGEFRLAKGIFHTAVPWWAIAQADQINALGATDEMAPWRLGTKYDRPVARRIVEDAGVDRGLFGNRKKNTASNTSFHWPHAGDCRSSFAEYLRSTGMKPPSDLKVWLYRRCCKCERLIYLNVVRRLGLPRPRWPWRNYRPCSLLFHWANAEIKKRYESGLRDLSEGVPDSEPTGAAP